ncbi:MAG: hypothetical protein IBX40_10660, partial [Methanosarcinales archaeon]|nr:hypothetical protein [Methanosarcinales archaeon]
MPQGIHIVYPTGMKLISTCCSDSWFRTAVPLQPDCYSQLTVATSFFHASGFVSASIVWLFIEEGPHGGSKLEFELRNISHI